MIRAVTLKNLIDCPLMVLTTMRYLSLLLLTANGGVFMAGAVKQISKKSEGEPKQFYLLLNAREILQAFGSSYLKHKKISANSDTACQFSWQCSNTEEQNDPNLENAYF